MASQHWFNSQLLKSCRRKLGWTQDELAKNASLSLRVIAKAEAGNRISQSTVRMLVQTLNDVGTEISCDDFTYDPRDIVQNFIHDCVQNGSGAIRVDRMLDKDVVVSVDGDSVTNPVAGKYYGVNEFEILLNKLSDIFARDGGTLGDITQMRLIDREIIAWGHEYIRAPEAPPSLPTFVMLRIELKNRRINHIDVYYDSAGLMSRVATWAKSFPNALWLKHFNLTSLLRCQETNTPIRQQALSRPLE